VAVLIEGKVVMVPWVVSSLRDTFMISGDFSEEEANRIAAGIVGGSAK
jgi:hypothetical protein